MPDETNSAVTDFLNESKSDIFQETPVTEELDVKEEKPLPFHRDPKVQRYVEKQISKALESRPQETRSEQVVPSDVKDVVDAFRTIIGTDTPEKLNALSALEKTLNGADERASQKAIERFQKQIEAQAEQQKEAEVKAQEELADYFDEIEETYNVDLSSQSASAKQLRSTFIEYVRKIAPKDAQGEVAAFPDLLGAFEDFQDRNKKPVNNRAKELAQRGITRSGDISTPTPTGRTWKDVEQYLAKLTK